MNILGIETSGKISSVALKTDESIFEVTGDKEMNHSAALVKDCERVLEDAGLTVKDVNRVAVGLGPGSFTGVRIGVTAAQSLAWTLDVDVGGVSTFRALAAMAAEECGIDNDILYIIGDARMNELFAGTYTITKGKISAEDLQLVSLDDAGSFLLPGGIVAGPGVLKYGRVLSERVDGLTVIEDFETPSARCIIDEAERAADFVDPLYTTVEPIYLKLSEPERRMKKKE